MNKKKTTPAAGSAPSVRMIPISEIRRGENPRRTFDPVALQELANSIRLQGVIQPISVRPVHPDDDGTTFAIIAGERRFRASGLADLSEIPCIVRDVDEVAAVELAIAENMERESLNPIDEAWGFQLLMQRGRTQAQIAERLHKSQPFVANRVRLLGLPDEIQGLVAEERLSPSAGIALCALSDFPDRLVEMADEALEKGWSVKMIEERAADFKRAEAQRVQPSMAVDEPEPEPQNAGPVNEAVGEGQKPDPSGTPPESVEAVSASPSEPGEASDEGTGYVIEASKPVNIMDTVKTDDPDDEPVAEEDGDQDLAPTAGSVEAEKPPRTDMDSAMDNYEAQKAAPAAATDSTKSVTERPAPTPPPPAPEPEPDPLEGYTDVPVLLTDYAACAERGLWPLSSILETVTDLEKSAMSPEAFAAADQLADINRNSMSVLEEPEIAVLQELFPDRDTTTAGHIASAMLVYRLRQVAGKMNDEVGTIIGQIEESVAEQLEGAVA